MLTIATILSRLKLCGFAHCTIGRSIQSYPQFAVWLPLDKKTGKSENECGREQQRLGYSPQKTAKGRKQSKTKSMIKEITFIIAIAAGITILGLAMSKAWDIQDRMTCQKLQQQEKDYPTFYSTAIEKEMCNSFGITLNK